LQGVWHVVEVCFEGCYVCEDVEEGSVQPRLVKFFWVPDLIFFFETIIKKKEYLNLFLIELSFFESRVCMEN